VLCFALEQQESVANLDQFVDLIARLFVLKIRGQGN
jgi:hypothetical protein